MMPQPSRAQQLGLLILLTLLVVYAIGRFLWR
jgi:hypothetical protein